MDSRCNKHYVSLKLALSLLSIFFLLLANSELSSQEQKKAAAIDEDIIINGQSISIHHDGTGSPTVIFEPGLNESYYTFRSIQDKLSGTCRTFSYSRASFQNIVDDYDKTSLRQVRYLHEVLDRAGEKGPYIIIAHSLGGFNARLFCAEYPNEVAGILFVDCSSENQPWSSSISSGELTAPQLRKSAQLVMETNKKDVLRNIPILVLVADYANQHFPQLDYWKGYQEELARRSNYSRLITVKNSGHQIQSDQPESVLSAFEELLKMIRQNN